MKLDISQGSSVSTAIMLTLRFMHRKLPPSWTASEFINLALKFADRRLFPTAPTWSSSEVGEPAFAQTDIQWHMHDLPVTLYAS